MIGPTFKDYLGDGVYAKIVHSGILLTTENGLPGDPSNSIFLEPEVVAALLRYLERVKAEVLARKVGGV